MVKRKASQVSASDEAERKSSDDAAAEESGMEAKPIGDVIKRTGRGRSERKFYEAFELDGARYSLEDSVLVTPEEKSQKPYVAIIKEIKESKDRSIAITGQWFYRPEEAERKGGGSWMADDTRELFYSFHRDEVPAESVMHKCVVHFIPPHKKSPPRSKHPGFIVRKVYDTVERKLWNLTDKDYEDAKQREINLLVQKTQQALGSLQDAEVEEVIAATVKPEKADKPVRRMLRRKSMPPPPPVLMVAKEEIVVADEGGGTPGARAGEEVETPGGSKGDQAVTPGAADGDVSAILRQMNVLTGNVKRDRWVEKVMSSVKSFFTTAPQEGPDAAGAAAKQEPQFTPEQAVAAVASLEAAAYEAMDERKFNVKMRSLEYNLRNGPVLARRLIAKELEPMTVVNMTPSELKDGMTAAEKSAQEPEQPQTLQMADVRCGLCAEPQVGVKDIINAPHGDRYQLECLKCGHCWYSARDFISNLTIETVKPSPTVGIAPWATSKFEDAEKKLEESEKEKEKEKEREAEAQEQQHKIESEKQSNDDAKQEQDAATAKTIDPTPEASKDVPGNSEMQQETAQEQAQAPSNKIEGDHRPKNTQEVDANPTATDPREVDAAGNPNNNPIEVGSSTNDQALTS